jgi:AbiV family abortive infection protein
MPAESDDAGSDFSGSGADDEPSIGVEAAATVEAAQAHAQDLLGAAKLLQDDFPHLAYHFAVLALEEIGRGVLLVVRASVTETDSSTGALADAMEDHVQKLFWALWSPSRADWISGGQIEEFRELARAIHERRKSGLYFDPTAAAPPREAVTAEETKTVIGLAEARLGMETTKRWVPVGAEQAENVRIFSEAVTDPRWREFVFSGPSLLKLTELRDVPSWIAWLREQIEDSERNAREAAEHELARVAPEGAEERLAEKWSMELRMFSDTHSIRQSTLNGWNDGVDWVKFRRADANQLIVQFTLPSGVLVTALWGTAYTLALQLLLSLNIGTTGFFWWRRRDDLATFFENLRDLETGDGVVIERSPSLKIEWGDRNVLNDVALSRVMTCFAMMPRDGNDPVVQALGHYVRGLALIAKTDIHIQFNTNVVQEFYLALRGGMEAYGDWDTDTSFVERFREFATRFFKGDEDEERFVQAVKLCEEDRIAEIDLPFEKAVIMKLLTDGFYLEKFHDLAAERRATEER